MNFYIIIILIITIIFVIGIIVNITSFNIFKNKIEKVFVINLERRNDRLNIFKNTYNFNIPFDIFNAVDGKTLNVYNLLNDNILGNIGKNSIIRIKNNLLRKYHYELTNEGAIGCYLSHYNIWKKIKKDNINNVLIFEDDTIINNISLNEINYRLDELPDDWNIYLLSRPNCCYNVKKTNKKNILKVNRFFLTNAYIINLKGINKIFNTNTILPINQQIDSYLSELAIDFKLNIYIHNKYKYYDQNNKLNTDIQINAENDDNLSYKRLLII